MKYMRERFGLKPDTAQIPGAVDTLVASPRTIPTDTGALKVVEQKEYKQCLRKDLLMS